MIAQDPHSMSTADDSRPQSLPEESFALIVGGGPIGLTTALALARYGYASVVVERHAQRLDQPKAHVLNPRALEIFRQMELDLTPLRKSGLQPEDADVIRFATAMMGTEFGGIQMAQDIEHQHSPEQLFNVPQPCLEEYLLELALATGKVTYLRMHEWQSCEETLGGTIVSRILVRRENVTKSIQSKYLVGCDGAKARTRDSLEIAFDPIMGDQEVTLHYVSVHFNADLSHMKSGLLWFLLAPPCVGVFIAYNRKNSWVFFIQYDPSTQSKETLTSEYLRGLVFQGVGQPVPDYKEEGITYWTTSPKLARTYRSPKIRQAFLLGDSAHSFPPTGGLGVNTGIADVQNWAWKVHGVEQGWAADHYLDTVTTERRAVARDNGRQSKINEDKIFRLVAAVMIPGRTPEELMADPAARARIESAIDDNDEHFNSPNLQLGYVYGRDHVRGPADYHKELIQGARLPHVWLDSQGQKISSLDLVDGSSFVLIAPRGFPVATTTYTPHRIPVVVKQLDLDFTDPTGEWQSLLKEFNAVAVLVRPDQHILSTIEPGGGDQIERDLLRLLHR